MLEIKIFVVNPLEENCYVVSDETKEAMIIDPGMFAEGEWTEVADYIRTERLNVKHCLLTHTHFDHIMGCHSVEKDMGLRPEGHADDVEQYKKLDRQIRDFFGFPIPVPDLPVFGKCVSDGDIVEFGSHKAVVIHTPGHSKGGVCYYIESEKVLFTGDTLFSGSMGRTDLQGGDESQILNSLLKLSRLDGQTRVYPGHGGITNIENEKRWIQAICRR